MTIKTIKYFFNKKILKFQQQEAEHSKNQQNSMPIKPIKYFFSKKILKFQ